jgi:hypothetical protein
MPSPLRNERRGLAFCKGEPISFLVEEVASANTVEGRFSFFIKFYAPILNS